MKTETEKTYLGLDFGGTKLLVGEMDGQGNILKSKRYPTLCKDQKEAVRVILEAVEDYQKTVGWRENLTAAGLGIVGQVDRRKGLWISMTHEITNPPIPLAAMLAQKLQVPCAMDNDVRSATTAELLLGAGRQSKDFIYLNVGTGLAAGFVADGHILRGANQNAGEIGHMVVDLSNPYPCICGRQGCGENMVSGIGFSRQLALTPVPEAMGENGRADVKKLFALAEAGHETAVRITEYAAKTLACVIMNLVRTTDPDMVILGGGIVSDGWLLEKVKAYLEPHTIRGVTKGVRLSTLDTGLAGLIGAAALGLQEVLRNEC